MTRFADPPSAITYLTKVFQEDGRAEPSVRAMEEAAVPEICALGCDLLSRLSTWYVGAISPLLPHPPFTDSVYSSSAERHLTPHAGRFTRLILFQLELAPPPYV